MSLRAYPKTDLGEILGDRVVYRNLTPVDRRLPSIDEFGSAIGLPAGRIPRKSEPEYARAIVHLLRRARALDAPGTELARLVYLGDTRLNDGTAFANICREGGFEGVAFIGAESNAPEAFQVEANPTGEVLYLANRWSLLGAFESYCVQHGMHIDEATAVVVDLDKTALGARGRNAQVIDRARIQAMHDTVAELLGESFDQVAFQAAYDELNEVDYHPFTKDNQDYLAYICLIVSSGIFSLPTVLAGVRDGRLISFEQFIDQVEARLDVLQPELAELHRQIYANVRRNDPTPFKAFRRKEYLATVARMGQLDDGVPLERMLAEEIVITQEVRAIALEWQARGALIFGLSDKPDEASLPNAEGSAGGLRPIHRTRTHAVGEE